MFNILCQGVMVLGGIVTSSYYQTVEAPCRGARPSYVCNDKNKSDFVVLDFDSRGAIPPTGVIIFSYLEVNKVGIKVISNDDTIEANMNGVLLKYRVLEEKCHKK